jgi:hypothetical protein
VKTRDLDLGALSWGAFFVAGGLLFLLKALDVWEVGADVIWPAILIAIGAWTIARGVEIEADKGHFGQPQRDTLTRSIESADPGRYSGR